MDASSRETTGLNLPPPVEQGAINAVEAQPLAQAMPEQAVAPIEKSAGIAQPAMPVQLPAMQMPDPVPQAQVSHPNDVSNTSKSKLSKVLDDPDLIEKEWVDKAKRIVAQNRDDPYKQSEGLTEVKAEYMKQQYDKTIKLNK